MRASLIRKSALSAAVALAGFAGLAHGSLVVDVTTSDPTLISAPGQVVNFTITATVTGQDANLTNEALQSAAGNILGTLGGSGGPGGNISAVSLATTPVAFNASGSSPGTPTDLNADGNLDNSGVNARASGQSPGETFVLGTFTWTANNANAGSDQITWVPKPAAGLVAGAVWQEDGSPKSNTTSGGGTYTAGPGVTLTAVATPEPGSLALAGIAGAGLLLRRRRHA